MPQELSMMMEPTTGESLTRLAEIAAAVSRVNQQHAVPGFPGFAGSRMNERPPLPMLQVTAAAFAAANLKRSSSSFTPSADDLLKAKGAADLPVALPPRKKIKRADESEDVRFREYQAEIWTEKFEDLCDFRRNHGHCHVPHTYKDNAPLAQWVKRQRYQYKLKLEGKRSTLTDERVKLLDKIGFIWNSHDAVWEERWNELLQYKQVHKDCIVPSNYKPNPQLAVWVKRQRRQYKFFCERKATSMTTERIAKLEQLGFAWDCRRLPKGDDESGRSPSPESEEPVSSSAASLMASVVQQQQQQQLQQLHQEQQQMALRRQLQLHYQASPSLLQAAASHAHNARMAELAAFHLATQGLPQATPAQQAAAFFRRSQQQQQQSASLNEFLAFSRQFC